MARSCTQRGLLQQAFIGTLYSEEGPSSRAVMVVARARGAAAARPLLLSIAWAVVAAVFALRRNGKRLLTVAYYLDPSVAFGNRMLGGVLVLASFAASATASGQQAGGWRRRAWREPFIGVMLVAAGVAARPDLRGPARLASRAFPRSRHHSSSQGSASRSRKDSTALPVDARLRSMARQRECPWLSRPRIGVRRRGVRWDAGGRSASRILRPARPFSSKPSRACSALMASLWVRLPIIPSTSPMSWPRSSSKVCSSRRSARRYPDHRSARGWWRSRRPLEPVGQVGDRQRIASAAL